MKNLFSKYIFRRILQKGVDACWKSDALARFLSSFVAACSLRFVKIRPAHGISTTKLSKYGKPESNVWESSALREGDRTGLNHQEIS